MLTLLLFPPTANSLLDRAIDAAEGSVTAPTHAAIQAGDAFYEAVYPLMRMMPAERLVPSALRTPILCSDEQAAAIVAYLRARVGTMHYSIQALGSDAFASLTGIRLPISRQEADCSGWIAEALVAAGVVTTFPRDPGSVTPAELADWTASAQPHEMFGAHAATSPEPSVAVAVVGDAGTTLVTLPAGSTVVTP